MRTGQPHLGPEPVVFDHHPAGKPPGTDAEKRGAALLEGPATTREEEVALRPDQGASAATTQRRASESDNGYDIQRDPGTRKARVAPEYLREEFMASPASLAALDVNLISSLVRWVSTAQQRLGIQYLEGFLELYIRATNGPPVLKEIIMYISNMLGNDEHPQGGSPGEPNIAQQWEDLMPQLHGILTAHCTPPEIPNLDLRTAL
jgi:hypothetical protein